MKESGKMVKQMARELIHFQMEENMQEDGKMVEASKQNSLIAQVEK